MIFLYKFRRKYYQCIRDVLIITPIRRQAVQVVHFYRSLFVETLKVFDSTLEAR